MLYMASYVEPLGFMQEFTVQTDEVMERLDTLEQPVCEFQLVVHVADPATCCEG